MFRSVFEISSEEVGKFFPYIDCPLIRLPITIKDLVSEKNNTLGIALPKPE